MLLKDDRTYRWVYSRSQADSYPDSRIEDERNGNYLISYSRSKYDRMYEAANKRFMDKIKETYK